MPFEKPDLQPKTMSKEEFFAKARALTEKEMRKLGLEKKEKNYSPENFNPLLKTTFQNPETGKEQEISLDIEKEIAFFGEFYQKNLGLEFDKAEILAIWKENYQEIKNEIGKYGYDQVLIIPENMSNAETLNQKLIETMDEGVGKSKVAATYQSDNFKEGGSFAGVANSEKSQCRIILIHSDQNIYNNSDANPYLKATLGKNIMALTSLNQEEIERRIAGNQEIIVNFEVDIDNQKIQIQAEGHSLEEYEILQRVFFEKTNKHLDESGWTWLMKSRSGARVVSASWDPGDRRLDVNADDPGDANDNLGLRLSRSFKKLA